MLCLSWVVVVYIPTRERSTYKEIKKTYVAVDVCALGGCSIGVLMRMDEGEERKRCW